MDRLQTFRAVALGLLMGVPGCSRPPEEPSMSPPSAQAESPNRSLLDEVNRAEAWFRARKTKPIWAREVTRRQQVTTLEGEEEVQPGDYLCRGEVGEIWPQKAERLLKNYEPVGETDESGWRRYHPRSDVEGVLAAQIDHPFVVHASWGDLAGKPGDYLVKNYTGRDSPYPDDVWIVDRELFQATYERVGD